MARLSAEHYRANTSMTPEHTRKSGRLRDIFKSRSSASPTDMSKLLPPVPSPLPSPTVKVGFEQVGLLPSERGSSKGSEPESFAGRSTSVPAFTAPPQIDMPTTFTVLPQINMPTIALEQNGGKRVSEALQAQAKSLQAVSVPHILDTSLDASGATHADKLKKVEQREKMQAADAVAGHDTGNLSGKLSGPDRLYPFLQDSAENEAFDMGDRYIPSLPLPRPTQVPRKSRSKFSPDMARDGSRDGHYFFNSNFAGAASKAMFSPTTLPVKDMSGDSTDFVSCLDDLLGDGPQPGTSEFQLAKRTSPDGSFTGSFDIRLNPKTGDFEITDTEESPTIVSTPSLEPSAEPAKGGKVEFKVPVSSHGSFESAESDHTSNRRSFASNIFDDNDSLSQGIREYVASKIAEVLVQHDRRHAESFDHVPAGSVNMTMNMQLPGLAMARSDRDTEVTKFSKKTRHPTTILGNTITPQIVAESLQLMFNTVLLALMGGAAILGPLSLALMVWRVSVLLAVYYIIIGWLYFLDENLVARLEGDIFFAPVIQLGRTAQNILGGLTAYLAGKVAHKTTDELRDMVTSVKTHAKALH